MKFIPKKHQAFCIEFLKEHPRAGLILDMGLGKTAVALTVADEDLWDEFSVDAFLVIAPKRVAEDTWTKEPAKWDHLSRLRVSTVLGTAKQRKAALARPADLYVINRENVTWLCRPDIWPFQGRHIGIIVDELSSFKDSQSKRWRALRKRIGGDLIVWGLTGTPAPKGYIDLWPQMFLLDEGKRLGRTLGSYRATFFTPGAHKGHVVYEWRLRPGAKDEIDRRLADGLCVSMRKEDWISMPPMLHNRVTVRMDAKEREVYEHLKKHKVLLQLDGKDLDTEVVGATAAALANKLLQLAGGSVYDESGGVVEVHSRKLDALAELTEEAQGQPLLVFYAYKHEADRIMKKFSQAVLMGKGEGKDTANIISRWNQGEIPMLVCHPASAGHGLNLQEGGHIIIWYSPIWDLELYQQANARLHRMGQTETVIVHHIVCEDTLDDHVLEVLAEKDQVQSSLIDALKAYIREENT